MRPPTACVACRNRRRKCEVTTPGAACVYCQTRRVSCSFAPLAQTNGVEGTWFHTSPTPPNTSEYEPTRCQSVSTQLPSRPLCIELVELYFLYIHDTFHSLFHRPSLMQDVLDGTVPRVLLFAIISLSARFSNDSFFAGIDPRVRGRRYAQEAEHLLKLREVSLTTIQACVLLGAFVITEGEAANEAVFYGIACRNALLLDLPNMLATSRVEQEVHRRAWWTLCMIDVWSSNGVRIPRSLTPKGDVPYPMEETVFLQLRREDFDLPSPTTMQESAASLLTQMVQLNAILVEIGTLNQMAVEQPTMVWSPTTATGFDFNHQAAVDELTLKLEGWYDNLPLELQDTHANLTRYAALGLGPMFVAVYLGYYHYGQLLYYAYLHQDTSANDTNDTTNSTTNDTNTNTNTNTTTQQTPARHTARFYADKCKAHSIGLCEILYRAYATPGCAVYYTMVGHVLVIASTVQLHILLFSSAEHTERSPHMIRAARSRLERNFDILTRLQTFWPTLDVCFTRFREFHRACLNYKESSFRMDRWMMQFLFEFAKPVEEKQGGNVDELAELRPWSMEDLGFSPF